jgi:fructokinase
MGDRAKYQAAVEKWAAISSAIKVSDDDLLWLYPNEEKEDVCRRWVKDGAALVVMTRGANGMVGFTEFGREEVPGVKIEVADTVGAGDTVGAVIVEAMIDHGIMALEGDQLKTVLTRAAAAAAITVSRKGAQPPYKHELKN